MTLAGIPISENECIGDSLDTINSAFITLSSFCKVKTGALNPSVVPVTPLFIGQEYLNTTTTKFFKASGLNSNDWVILN